MNDKENIDLEESFKAYKELIILMDLWNKDWKPNWKTQLPKYSIVSSNAGIVKLTTYNVSRPLTFQDSKTRDVFLNTFEQLLLKAEGLF
jgi:hypothetical protein